MNRVLTLSLVALAAACSSRNLKGGGRPDGGDAGQAPDGAGGGTQPTERVIEIPRGSVNHELDVVFVIDNSGATAALQRKVVAGFQGFVRSLAAPTGELPYLHVAVVSTDIGAGAYDVVDIPTCQHGGDRGIFQNTPRGTTCAAGTLNDDQRFLSTAGGNKNFQGTLEDAFGCIAPLGDQGCGFEHPVGSLLRALGADGNGGPPIENANFLRPNALLAVVIVTNEDDCSAPINSTFFDPTSRHVSDPLGPLSSFRCNEYGHLCGGKRPSRTAPQDLSGTCHSAEDGHLLRVADIAAALKLLKPGTPEKVVVSVIAAPPSPYKTELTPPALADDPSLWPSIAHSCSAGDGSWGDPAVRLSDLAEAFGANGSFESLCVDSFEPALRRTAEIVKKTVAPPCLTDKVVDADPATPMLEPDCTAVAYDDHGSSAPLARCAGTAGVACWELVSDAASCGEGKRVGFRLAPGWVSSPEATLTCKVCAPNDPRPGCQY